MDQMKPSVPPSDVADSIKIFLRRKGTIREAAQKLGVAPTTLSTQLSGKDFLSQRIAGRLHDAFGFDIDYMTTGQGSLFGDEHKEVILPKSYTIEFGSKDALPGGPDTAGTASALWRAVDALCAELNDFRASYMANMESIHNIARMIPRGTEEAKWADKVEEVLKSVFIPDVKRV